MRFLILALLCLASLLTVGLLTAAPLGPQALGVSLPAAFVSATIGGLLVALIARAPAEIAAPAPSTTVVHAALAADLVGRGGGFWEIWAAMSLAVVLMGLMLLLAGGLRLAGFAKFLPTPVSAGVVSGIGLLVIWSQLGPVLGLQATRLDGLAVLQQLKPASLLVAGVTLAGLLLVPRLRSRVPPLLVAVAAGTATYYLLAALFGAGALGGTLHPLRPQAALGSAASVWQVATPGWVLATALAVLPYAGLLALQATLNAAVSAVTVGNALGQRSDVNRTLVAQGLANVLCGAAGALPICTSAVLSGGAIGIKGNPRNLAAGAAVVLFLLVLAAGHWVTWVPIAVLSAVLMMGGVAMVDQSALRLARGAWSARSLDRGTLYTLGIAVVVAAALFLGSVPLALMIGTALAMVLLAIELSGATGFGGGQRSHSGSRRVWPGAQAEWLREHRAAIAVVRPHGALFFGTADQVARQLGAAEPGTRFCILDLSRVTTVDATACEIIAAAARGQAAAGVQPLLAGIAPESARCRQLLALGLSFPPARTHWFADVDRALESAEAALLKERWPDFDRPHAFELADTPLAAGMGEHELRELAACLREVRAPTGPLFLHGEPSGSLYIIAEGQVEIRIAGARDGDHARLAALFPGALFGEISLLLAQRRTADAICVTPARLLELDREGLAALEKRSPQAYACVMRNLAVQIATRLDLATGLVRTLQ